MDEFKEKWQNDKKYQAKIKLSIYGLFVLAVTIFAISSNNSRPIENTIDNQEEYEYNENAIISIPSAYTYSITINNDDKTYKYSGTVMPDQETITKEKDGTTKNYIYKNNEYYLLDGEIYTQTTKEEVYDVINHTYIDLNNINNYLSKATKNGNQYLVYLKDIILDDNTEDYFTITINDSIINIDYTTLMKRYNNDIENYNVDIIIENKEVE